MQRVVYEDGKYCIQDVGRVYIGSKYTLGEILENEEIIFKFRMLTERYLLAHADPEDTLETHLYYLDNTNFLVQIYSRMKAMVKINIIEEKKRLTGAPVKQYTTKTIPVRELAEMSVDEKEEKGVVVQELSISKVALLTI